MRFANIYLLFIFELFVVLLSVSCVVRRDVECGNNMVFLRFCVSVLSPRAMAMTNHFPSEHAICKYPFTFHLRVYHTLLVACFVRRLSYSFFLRRRFFPAAQSIFSDNIFFENATHCIFLLTFVFLPTFEIQCHDWNSRVCVHWLRRLRGGG